MPDNQYSTDTQRLAGCTVPLDTVDIFPQQNADTTLEPIMRFVSTPNSDVSLLLNCSAGIFTICGGILHWRNYHPQGRTWLLVITVSFKPRLLGQTTTTSLLVTLDSRKRTFDGARSSFRKVSIGPSTSMYGHALNVIQRYAAIPQQLAYFGGLLNRDSPFNKYA